MADLELQRLEQSAQASATRSGQAMAVFNLNMAGRRLLVIRSADSFPGEGRMVAGPFNPVAPDVAAIAESYGFELEVAGGGALILSRYWKCGPHLWLTCPDGGGLPTQEEWEIGLYDSDGDQCDGWRSDAPSGAPYRLVGAVQAAVRAAQMALPSTESLSDELAEWCEGQGLPVMSADELMAEIAGDDSRRAAYDWLARFCERWNEAQEWEDYKSACEARGEEF